MIIAYRLSYFLENSSRTESIFLFENKKIEGIMCIEKTNQLTYLVLVNFRFFWLTIFLTI